MSAINRQAKAVLKGVPVKDAFTKVYGDFNQYWKNMSPLYQSGIQQQLEKQFEPTVTQGILGLKRGFANRGLSRSGIRAGAENQFLDQTSQDFATQAEQLLNLRQQNAGDYYNLQQQRYEKSPTGYVKNHPNLGEQAGYTVDAPVAQQGIGDVYGGAGTYQGAEGGPSYLQSYRDYLKKKTPDFYKKYYGA